MDLLSLSFLLMLGLLVSNVVGHYLPFIPMALTQIVFGLTAALLLRDYSFEIGAEWFMLLYVAPLLYNDGRHFSREELWAMRAPIFGNAIILVILTTVLCGYMINRLIPGIPLAAALALAAILSPTDPVAVNGIAKRIRIPEKVMVLVRGESLINDASGLVAFKYAIGAAVTGYFSLREAAWDFSYTFLIGAIAGIILGLLITFVRLKLRKSGIDDPVFHSLLQILTPFAVYFITEEMLHASGVIAVVAAGILHSVVREHTVTFQAEEQLLTENTWSIVLFVLNGFVFLLLGMTIPTAMFQIIADPHIGKWQAFGYVFAICFVILAVRFLWTLVSKALYYLRNRGDAEKPELRTALITSLVGVRGAVTMAGVLTVPFFLGNGELFPARSLLIFLAAGVILLSLILATLFLPLLCKKGAFAGEAAECGDLTRAKNKLLLAAIRSIKTETTADNELAASELISEYTASFKRSLSGQKSAEANARQYNRKMNEVRVLALNLQRKYISSLLAQGEIDIKLFDTLMKLLYYREEALDYHFVFGTMLFIKRVMRDFGHWGSKYYRYGGSDNLYLIRDVQIRAIIAAIKGLEEQAKNRENPEYVYAVILEYEKMLQRLKLNGDRYADKLEEQKEELRFKVLDAERAEIRRMYEAGEINAKQERELRRFTNYIESMVLYEHHE